MDNGINTLRDHLEDLPTGELDVILNRELEAETPDGALIKTVMDIIYEREKDLPLEITPGIRAAWERYRGSIRELEDQERKSRRRRSFLRLTATAAVLCLVILALPGKARAESLFEKLTRWSNSVVEFFSPQTQNDNQLEYTFTSENPGLHQVYEAVTALGVADPVVPMWLPEGYELMECKTIETSQKKGVVTWFQEGNNQLTYKIDVYNEDVSHEYHKDETSVAFYDRGGVEHKILKNNDRWVVLWFRDRTECSLSVDCPEETLYEILRSIYVTEDSDEEIN